MVELIIFSSGQGKTGLLCPLATISAFPRLYNGGESIIVCFDIRGRFPALRSYQVLHRHLAETHETPRHRTETPLPKAPFNIPASSVHTLFQNLSAPDGTIAILDISNTNPRVEV